MKTTAKIFAVALLVAYTPLAAAQNRTIEVNVTTASVPAAQIGLIITDSGTIQKPVSSLERVNEEQYVVTFPYSPEEVKGGSLASAMLIGEDGEVAFGDVKLISGAVAAKSFLTLPDCPAAEPDISGVKDQIGLLENLVTIRTGRKEANTLIISRLMSGEFLAKLSKLENGFGLKYSSKLSPDLDSVTLVDRLSRLSTAIKNYQNRKGE